MPKIKNWSRLENEPGGPTWQHDKKRTTVKVEGPRLYRSGYRVVRRRDGGSSVIRKNLETKEDAVDTAIKYMRANTNPGSHSSPSQRRSRANGGR